MTMKWSEKIAQGFSPGLTRRAKRALKVATEGWG